MDLSAAARRDRRMLIWVLSSSPHFLNLALHSSAFGSSFTMAYTAVYWCGSFRRVGMDGGGGGVVL